MERLKWSQKIGHLAKVYPEPLKGIRDDDATSIYRPPHSLRRRLRLKRCVVTEPSRRYPRSIRYIQTQLSTWKRQAGVIGNVLNHYNFGGFLIFNHIPVFIDGRADMYGDEFIERFKQAQIGGKNESDFSEILSEYDIGWTISVPGKALAESLDKLSGWKEIHRDKYAIVHMRETQ